VPILIAGVVILIIWRKTMKDEITITRLKKLTKQRNFLMKKVGQLDDRISAILMLYRLCQIVSIVAWIEQ